MSIVTYNNRSIRNISAVPGAARSLVHIKTLTASSSATLTFLHGSSDVVFDSTYPIYRLVYTNMHPSQQSIFSFQTTTDGTNYNTTVTSTAFGVYNAESGGDNSGANNFPAAGIDTGQDQANGTAFQGLMSFGSNIADNDAAFSGELTIFNPSSTTFVKHWMSDLNFYGGSNYSQRSQHAGYFNTTSAITGIQFKQDNGNIDAGTIKLYGISDS